jgi:hypothetical protein
MLSKRNRRIERVVADKMVADKVVEGKEDRKAEKDNVVDKGGQLLIDKRNNQDRT